MNLRENDQGTRRFFKIVNTKNTQNREVKVFFFAHRRNEVDRPQLVSGHKNELHMHSAE